MDETTRVVIKVRPPSRPIVFNASFQDTHSRLIGGVQHRRWPYARHKHGPAEGLSKLRTSRFSKIEIDQCRGIGIRMHEIGEQPEIAAGSVWRTRHPEAAPNLHYS